MFKKIIIVIFLSSCTLSESHAKWEIEPLYSAEYQPMMIKEGFQMTHALSFARSNPDFVYLCTDTSRVWRSTDRGQSWTQRSNGMISNGCRSLLVDPANPDRVIAAGFFGVFAEKSKNRKFQHQGIYLTENGGREWSLVGEAPFYRQVSKAPLIVIDSSTIGKAKTSTWYAGSFDGLYVSTDAGLSWNRVSPNINSICALEEVPGNQVIYL